MSPIVQGLDRAAAPPADAAKRMLDSIGGRWWNVYIGGPSSSASGWSPELVQAYVAHGIDRFMLTYAGRQKHGPLTHAQGQADAVDALGRARAFGYSGNFPICLDIEHPTFESAPGPTVDYARGWCEGIKAHGARPGIYANPDALRAMHGKVDAHFVWVASWVSHAATHHDPHAALGVPSAHWSKQGQRAWQYAGERSLMGMNVDINVADLDVLASAPGVASGNATIATPAHTKVLARRGDSGPVVQRLTRRLSFVVSRRTDKPYLDGARARFDAETVAALKAFQEEHGLKASGVFGPRTARALRRSVEIRKAKAAKAKQQAGGHAGPGKQHPAHHNGNASGAGQLVALVNELRKSEAETDRAWKALVAYGEKRRELFRRVRSEKGDDVSLADLAAILLRIEHEVEALVEMEQRELAQSAEPVATTQTAAPAVEPAPATPAAPIPAPVATTETVAAEVAAPVAAAHGNGEAASPGPAPPEPAPPTPHPALHIDLSKLTDDELIRRVDRLDLGVDRSRDVLIARYAQVEKRLAPLAREQPARHGGNGSVTPVTPVKPPVKQVHGPAGVRNLQKLLNAFAAKHLKGTGPLAVDGKIGPQTKARIRAVKFYLGYGNKTRKSAAVDAKLLNRLRRPASPRYSNPAMLARGRTRRRKQHKVAKRSAAPHAGVVKFDGRPVAAWMAPYLHWARDNGWPGTLNSGWRSPEHSEHLCMVKCGKVKCPNTCAGRSSNHVGRVKPQGAIDVSHYDEFAELMRRCPITPRIFNDLPSDRVHFSATGH